MEIWKPLKNFPSYDGSSEGRIRNIRTQRILKTYINEKGYETVCLRKNGRQHTVKVSKVIAETFLGEHPGMDVRNKNGERSKSSVDNLVWCTRSETISAAFERGTKKPSRCSRVQVIETGDIYDSVADCARGLCCCRSDIYKHLSGMLPHVKGFHIKRLLH